MESTLEVPDDCLLVFIDDTGHEELISSPVFGLGGCAIISQRYQELLKAPWRKMQTHYFGEGSFPNRAAEAPRACSPQQMAAIGNFFRQGVFSRFAVVLKTTSPLPGPLCPYQTVAGFLMERAAKASSEWHPNRVAAIIESSKRADLLAKRYFAGRMFTINQRTLPTEWFFLPKTSHEAGLEVADFVVNAAHGRAKARLSGEPARRRDFECVFKSRPNLTAAVEIDSASISSGGRPVPGHYRHFHLVFQTVSKTSQAGSTFE